MMRETGCDLCCLSLFFFCMAILGGFPIVHASDDYSFDLEAFEKKSLDWGGFIELEWEHVDLNQDSAFYQLAFLQEPRSTLDRYSATLQLDGSYQQEMLSLNWLFQAAAHQDDVEWNDSADLYEAYASVKPLPSATFNGGKKTYKWGKGYAWNPAGVIDRPKDPSNPEESLEGFAGVEMDLIKSLSGSLQTVALTTVLVPVTDDINTDFGKTGANVAAKLYLLYNDTDIDFIWFDGDSRPTRYGIDFAKNLAPSFEIHGELVHTPEQKQIRLFKDGSVGVEEIAGTSYLAGIRCLTANDLTAIVEFYHNDNGYSQADMERFFRLVHDAADDYQGTENTVLLKKAQQLVKSGYGKPQLGRDYLYIKASQKEPLELLYTTPALTAIVNLEDKSFSISPEITYTGFTNWEWRLRLTVLSGGALTEFGEKQMENKLEVRLRYFF